MDFANHVKLRQEKFGAVVFDTLNEKVYATNESGGEILSLIAQGLSAEDISERLGQDYTEDAAGIQEDVQEFIQGLQSAGLLAPVAEGQS